jgi:hypothetical protein
MVKDKMTNATTISINVMAFLSILKNKGRLLITKV